MIKKCSVLISRRLHMDHSGISSLRIRYLGLLCLIVLAFLFNPLAVDAAYEVISGNPLNIESETDGRKKAYFEDQYQYFDENDWGSALFLTDGATTYDFAGAYHVNDNTNRQNFGTLFTPISHSKSDPMAIDTVFTAGATGVNISQKIEYIDGQSYYKMTWILTNTHATKTYTNLRFFQGGDTYFGGDDNARAYWYAEEGMVYIKNAGVSGLMCFYGNSDSPPDHYFAGNWDTNNAHVAAGLLTDVADPVYKDCGYSLQWNRVQLAPGEEWTIVAYEKWTDAAEVQVIAPADRTTPPDQTKTYSFRVQNFRGEEDTFDLSIAASLSGWNPVITSDSSVTLTDGEAVSVAVTITVPDIRDPLVNTLTLTATSQAVGTVFNADSMNCVITTENHAPELDISQAPVLTSVIQNNINNLGNTVAEIVVDGSITDVDGGVVEAIAITYVDTSQGSWEFSKDNGSTWLNMDSAAENQAVLLDADHRVRIVPNGTSGNAIFLFRAWDKTPELPGQSGNATINGGSSAYSFARDTAIVSVIVANENDAPVLDNTQSPVLAAISKNNTTSTGSTIDEIIVTGSISDADGPAATAVAVISVDTTNGVWEYSIDGGQNWNTLDPSATSARLLRDSNRVRFIPKSDWAGSAAIIFRAWDMSSGTAGTTSDASTGGTDTAFSTATDTATIAVLATNTAPVLDTSASHWLTPVNEDNFASPGTYVSDFIQDGSITDNDGTAFKAIAVINADSANGMWQFSTDNGENWSSLAPPSHEADSRLLESTHRIRFIPIADFNGLATIQFRAWDKSSGLSGGTADTNTPGGSSPYSIAIGDAGVNIKSVNDAPTFKDNAVLTAVDQDTAGSGETIATLFNGKFQDIDYAASLFGVAVTGNTANPGMEGVWQYTSDGTNWVDVGSVSEATALMISSASKLRFVPVAGYSGTPPALNVRATDNAYAGSFSSTTDGTEIRSTIDASLNGGISPVSGTLNAINTTILNTGDAAYFKITGAAVMAAGGSQIITITTYDSSNNVAHYYTGDKSLTFSGATDSSSPVTTPTVGGTDFGSAITVTFVNGVGSATMTLYNAGPTSIDVTDGLLDSTGDVSYDLDVTVSSGGASQIVWTTAPSTSAIAGADWTAFTAEIRDSYGNVCTDINTAVTIEPATLEGTLSVNAINGVVTFNAVKEETSGTVSVTAKYGGLSTTSQDVAVGSGGANQIVWTTAPATSATAGTDWTAFTAEIRDSFGNVCTDINAAVTIEPSTLEGSLSVTATNGVVTFTGIKEESAGIVSVIATYSGFSTALQDVTIEAVAPIVTTAATAGVTHISAISGGHVTSDGGYAGTVRGLCWSTSPAPTTSSSIAEDGDTGSGSFTGTLNDLMPGGTYYVRAYATNGAGTSYGNEIEFTALGVSWTGNGGDGLWSNSANWSPNRVPAISDDVYFGLNNPLDNSVAIIVDENAEMNSVTIVDTFDGSITVGLGNPFTTGNYAQNGGTFNCGEGPVDINGDFDHTGGEFIAPSGLLNIAGDFTSTGGTYTHNGGTVELDGTDQTIEGNIEFCSLVKYVDMADTLTLADNSNIQIICEADMGYTGTDPVAELVFDFDCSGGGTKPVIQPMGDVTFDQVNYGDCVTVIPAVSLVPVATTTLIEGNQETLQIRVELNVAGTENATVYVGLSNAPGDAEEDVDYTSTLPDTKEISIPAGTLEAVMEFTVVNDDIYEASNETFEITIESLDNGNIRDGEQKQTITITDTGNPGVLTNDVDDTGVTHVSAEISGAVEFEGSSAVTVSGFIWNPTPPALPSIDSVTTIDGALAGTYFTTAENLIPGVEYQVRAYAINENGIGYGSYEIFRTTGNSWIGGSGDWSDPTNWSRGEVPDSDDDVYIGLNTDSGEITIAVDEDVDINSLFIDETFEGTIVVASGNSFTTGRYEQNGGTFDCGEGPVDINGDFIHTGGRFIAPSGELTVEGDFTGSENFEHNGGIVTLDGGDQSISGNTVFNNLIKDVSEAAVLTFESGTSTIVSGTLDLSGENEGELLTLNCSDLGAPVIIIIESDSSMENVDPNDCIRFVYRSSGGGSSDVPQATLSNIPLPVSKATSYSLDVGGIGVVAYRYRLDDENLWGSEADIATALDFTLATEGAHTIYVIGKDGSDSWQAVDNATAFTWVIDTTPPVAKVGNAPEGTVGITAAKLNVSGTIENAIAYKYRVDGGDWSSQVIIDQPIALSGLADGLHEVDVIAKDAAGNWQSDGSPTTISWTVDLSHLQVELDGVPESLTRETGADITVSGENVVACMYSIDGGPWTYGEVGTPISMTGLADGYHTLKVRGLSEAGDVGDTGVGAVVRTWLVDTTAAATIDLTATEGIPSATSANLSWTWASESAPEILGGYRVWYSTSTITEGLLENAVEVFCSNVPGAEGIREFLKINGLTPGTAYFFAVKSIDLAGNVSDLSNVASLTTSTNLPIITALSLIGGGNTADNSVDQAIIVTGTEFVAAPGDNILRFENGSVVFDIRNTGGSSTEMTANVPAGAPTGTYSVRVINKYGVSLPLADTYTVTASSVPMPEVTNLSPQMIIAGTPTAVTIKGENFTAPITGVWIEATDGTRTPLTGVLSVDSETITGTVDVPAGFEEGRYQVIVENANGNSNNISTMQIEIAAPTVLDDEDGSVDTSGPVEVDGDVPGDTVLTTDDRDEVEPVSTHPGRINLFIDAGSIFEEFLNDNWIDYNGIINPPREVPLSANVASQVGDFSIEFTIGAENQLRLTNGDNMLMTVEMTVPANAPVPSLYYLAPDGSISVAGIAGSRDGVDYVPGGVVLSVREDSPEDEYVTYTIGALLNELGNHYAAGSKGTGDTYGPCFIGTADVTGGKLPLVISLLMLVIMAGLRFWKKTVIVPVICLILLMVAGYGTAEASYSDEDKWYILAGAGYQQISEKYNSLYYGTNQTLTVDNDIYPLLRGGWNFNEHLSLEGGFRYDIMSGRMEKNQMGGEDNVKGISLLMGPVYRFDSMNTKYIGDWIPFLKGDLGFKKVNNGLAYAVKDYDPTYGIELAVGMLKGPFDLRLGYAYYTHDTSDTTAGYTASGSSSSLGLSGLFMEVAYRFSFGDRLQKKAGRHDTDGDGVEDRFDDCPGTSKGVLVDTRGCRVDLDNDGVYDEDDECPDTPIAVKVNNRGCPSDTDLDGISDSMDYCPDTPEGITVDDRGCSLDTDRDGVKNSLDMCPETPEGTEVNESGCPVEEDDSDNDGVPDSRDECPGTPDGAAVKADGCPVDSDGDGVFDYLDACPGSPKGATIDERGCWRLKGVSFDSGKTNIKPAMYDVLQRLIKVLRDNPEIKLEVQGYTDSQGNAEMNRKLSEKRANSIRSYLIKYHIGKDRLTSKGYGEENPAASNDTPEGRAKNRRVELKPVD